MRFQKIEIWKLRDLLPYDFTLRLICVFKSYGLKNSLYIYHF